MVSRQGRLKSILDLGFKRKVRLKLFKSGDNKGTEPGLKRIFWRQETDNIWPK